MTRGTDRNFNATRTEVFPTAMRVTTACAVCVPDNVRRPPLLLVLHGWGQTAPAFLRGFRPLARAGWLVAAPQAPHPFYIDPGKGRVGYSWLTREHRDEAVRDTNAYLDETLAALAERHEYDAGRVALLGFSQGSSVAWRYLSARPGAVYAIASCCADLPPDVRPTVEQLPPCPAFVAWCPHDRVVPPSVSVEQAELLRDYGWPVTSLRFDGGHRVTAELVSRAGTWLEECSP